jgi:regulator of protease activity HflC (stomatin/prohibitin superfamily)
MPDEAVMITGDGNLLELQGTVRYTIAVPHEYLFAAADVDSVLRSAAESVLRERVGSSTFTALLTRDREALQREVLRRLEERCAEYGPAGLGVRLEGVALHDLHPPQEVVTAYHEVTRAMERRDEKVNRAEAERVSMVRGQEGENLQIVRRAQAERTQKVRLAQGQLAAFRARYEQRTGLALTTEWRLVRQAWAAAPGHVLGEYRRRRGEALAVQEALTDFRLFWDALGRSLAGREKVLIDSDKPPGRRGLWMLPPELLRWPMMFNGRGARPAREGAEEP